MALNFDSDLELGWAAGLAAPGVQSFWPSQDSMATPGSSSFSRPSQKTPPSLVLATLVKIVFFFSVSMAIGLVRWLVPVPTTDSVQPFQRLLLAISTGTDAEEAVLGIDGAQTAVGVEAHPGDVVADALDAVAGQRRRHHGHVGLAALAGEGRRHVPFPAKSVRHADDLIAQSHSNQHLF